MLRNIANREMHIKGVSGMRILSTLELITGNTVDDTGKSIWNIAEPETGNRAGDTDRNIPIKSKSGNRLLIKRKKKK
jgi:hypothetical protein